MKTIIINEKQLKRILSESLKRVFENSESEGFSFGSRGRGSDKTFRFTPMKNDTNTDTRIFDDTGNFKVREITLPKSGVKSYNLYKITNMNISRALKHREEQNFDYDDRSMNLFMSRTALYIKHLIGNAPVDILTCPQSSSKFNTEMISYLLRLFPSSEGIRFIPDMLIKNVKNVYVNTEIAKEIGLTDAEIYTLQNRIEKWKTDEDIREVRKKMDKLEAEIMSVTKNRGRGRPNKDFVNKVKLLNSYQEQLPLLRKGKKGRDSTVDGNGKVKDFQIKSINDRERRSIEGLFQINPSLNGIQQKLVGKHVVIFDDNISSGATLDDICIALQKIGVASILAITLAVIPKTIYGSHEKIS